MKKTKYFVTTILMMILLALGTGTAYASTYEGRLDNIQGDTISGWAWDSADPASSAVVRLEVKQMGTSELVQDVIVTADQPRADLASLGKGDGTYGFSANIDWSVLDQSMSYTVDAYIGDMLLNSLTWHNTSSGTALIPLGTFKTTAYCPCRSCSEGWGRHTSTGAMAAANHTIAVDPRVIPYGSRIMINGIIYTAEDRGGGVKGNHIDIFFNTHGETRQYGLRSVEAFLVR